MSGFGVLHVGISGATSIGLSSSEDYILHLDFPDRIAKNASVESSKKKPAAVGEWGLSADQKLTGDVIGASLSFKVFEHHTFSNNKRVGEGTVSLDDLRGGGKLNTSVTVTAPNGSKLVEVKVNMCWVGPPPASVMPPPQAAVFAAPAGSPAAAVAAAPAASSGGGVTTATETAQNYVGTNADIAVDASLPPLPACENRAYTIRVLVHKARNLQSNDDDKEYDPLISVTIGEETKKSDYQKGTINPYFDEELFFMVPKADSNFWTTPIQISVMDHYMVGPNREIGMSQMDTGAVYRNDDHFMQNKWLVLRKGEMSTQIMGFLKVSVMVLDAVNDPIPEIDDEDEDEEENEEEIVMGLLNAPGATYEEVYVRCELFKGSGMPKMDAGSLVGPGLCDPFVKLVYGIKKTKISHKSGTLEPVWDAVTCLPVLLPSLTDTVFVSLWDYNSVGFNNIIATNKLSFNSMVSGSGNGLPYLSSRYINFYGSPREKTFIGMSGKYLDKMDEGLKNGVDYRGRVLLRLVGTREKNDAKLPITQRPDEATVSFAAVLQGLQFSMLPKGDYRLSLSVATFNTKTEKRPAKAMMGKGSDLAAVFFGDEIRITGELLVVVPKNAGDASVASQFPDLIVHIIRGDTLYGSARVPAKDLLERPDAAYRCTTMMVMIDPDKTDEGEQPPAPLGQFYCAMYATGTKFSDVHVPVETDKAMVTLRSDVKMPAISMEAQKPYMLETCVYQGRQLPSGDSNGLSDPFVRMSWANGVAQTGIKEETLNPIYNEMLVLEADAKQKFPDVVIEVWDWDLFGSNTFLCRRILSFDDMLKRKDEKWWVDGFKDSKNRDCPAALLLSFELMERAAMKMPPVVQFLRKRGSRATYKGYEIWSKKRIATRPYRLDINVFALRKMRKFRMMDIKCPSIDLQVGETVAEVPKKSGANPDFNKQFSFVVDLPDEKKYLPQLNVRVFDNRIGTKSLVGSAILSMDADKYDPQKQLAVRNAADGEVDKRIVKLVENKRLRLQGVDVLKKEKQDAKRNAAAFKRGLRANINNDSDERYSSAENTYSAPLLSEANPADVVESDAEVNDQPLDAMEALQNFDNRNNAQFDDEVAPTEAEGELTADDIPWFDRFDPPEDIADEMKPEYMVSRLHKLVKDGRKTTAEEQFGPFNDEHDAVLLGRGWGKKRVKAGELSMMFTIAPTNDKPTDKVVPTELMARKGVEYVCRVYIMSCSHLAAKDNSIFGSASDPYPVFTLSDGSENNDKKKIIKMKCTDDRKYQTLNPEYFIMREVAGELPQHGNLRIEIFDWDRIGSHELIGFTDINLEDRWFSCRGYPERRMTTLSPGSYTEKRTLVDPQGQAQGRIELWVDMFSKKEEIPRAISIAPHPPIEMELRVVVWSVRDCVLSDVSFAGEAMTDIYVRAWMNGMRGDRQETDVHYRSLDGSGNFNWRMAFPFVFDPRSKKVMPVSSKSTSSSFFRIRKEQKKLEPALKVQIFDNDLFPGTDDFIGEANLNILKMRPARTRRDTTDMLTMIFKDVTTCFGLCDCCFKKKRLDDLTLEERQELAVKEFKKDMAEQKEEWGKEAERRVSALRSSKDPVFTEQQLAVFREQFYKEARRKSMVNALDAFTPKRKASDPDAVLEVEPPMAEPEAPVADDAGEGGDAAAEEETTKTTSLLEDTLPHNSTTTKYWFSCRGPKGAGRVGDVQLSFEAVRVRALKVNLKLEAGKGRDGPQQLNPPVRPESSFFFLTSPYKAAVHILWKNYKWYILGCLCFALLVLLGLVILYYSEVAIVEKTFRVDEPAYVVEHKP